MHPEICQIGPFTVYSYGLMLAIAFAVASTLFVAQAKNQQSDPECAFNLIFTVFICGIIGARIFYVIQNFAYYWNNPLEIVMLQHGGLAWFGGLIAGVSAGAFYLKRKKLPFLKMMDLFAPFVALGQAIGRIGCLLNGCCFGAESAYGIYFPVHKAILVPVQIYSSVFLLIIFVVLRFLQDRDHPAGRIFYAYLLLYSFKRFFIEYARADNVRLFFGLTLFQVLSIPIFVFAVIQLSRIRHPNSIIR